ncbi:hypothetical protein R6Q59_010506 [Mikania micrantha]
MIRSKVKELDSFVVDVEKLITRCLQEIQTDDVILNPIEEWMSRFTKYNEISKNKHKTDKEGANNKLQEVHSQGKQTTYILFFNAINLLGLIQDTYNLVQFFCV